MPYLNKNLRKFLAIDHGDRRIGLAISDETATLARALFIIEHVSRSKDAERINDIARNEFCTDILVGVPYDSDGNEGPRARKVLRFVSELKELSELPVHLWDESGSTLKRQNLSIQMGQSSKKRQQPHDDLVAAIILQDYLDCHWNPPITGMNDEETN